MSEERGAIFESANVLSYVPLRISQFASQGLPQRLPAPCQVACTLACHNFEPVEADLRGRAGHREAHAAQRHTDCQIGFKRIDAGA